MEKSAVDIERIVQGDPEKLSNSSGELHEVAQEPAEGAPKAPSENADDPGVDYSSKAKDKTTFSHYLVGE